MKFFKWAYDKEWDAIVLLTEYAVSENITQATALSRTRNSTMADKAIP